MHLSPEVQEVMRWIGVAWISIPAELKALLTACITLTLVISMFRVFHN